MKNLKEFKELIKTYESITTQDIVDSDGYRPNPDWDEPSAESWSSELVMKDLTGFGSLTCTLCEVAGINYKKPVIPTQDRCSGCAWIVLTGKLCYKGPNKDTYDNFSDINIDSEKHLVEACKTRAEYIRDVLIQNNLE